MKITFKTILIYLLIPFSVTAQKKDSLNIAEAFLESENFSHAIRFYRDFLYQDPDNPELNFKLGFALLNTTNGKEKSIKYLKKATKVYGKSRRSRRKIEYIESYFYLARAYRAAYKFDKAIELFTDMKKKFTWRKIQKEIDLELKLCNDGKKLFNNPIDVTIKPLGNKINSKYSDHSPVFTADESVIIFTSRRKNNSGGIADMDGQYDENIFVSRKKNGKWTEPVGISDTINTAEHEASISLSVDGQYLFIYKGDENGSIYQSELKGKKWNKPIKLGKNINSRYRETHASISADGNSLYFTSNRKGGYGGLDIYVSKKQKNGTWGKAKNLGEGVNTPVNEESPYIHPDGKTLYFSSEGHVNMGGYDIFKSEINEFGTWSEAQNIGYPLNTVDDDVFFLPTADGTRAYYTSSKQGGLGSNDIYMVYLNSEKETQIAIMIGKVYTQCLKKIPDSKITVMDYETETESYYTPNSETGKFIFIGYRGDAFLIKAEVNNKIVYTDTLIIRKDSPYKQVYNSIRLDPDETCLQKITQIKYSSKIKKENIDDKGYVYDDNVYVKNIMFRYNQTDFSTNKSVSILIKYLKKYPKAIIEVGAYADSRGSAKYNYKLTVRRAKAIKRYMLKRGVKLKQVIAVGYGEENPISFNKINNLKNYKSAKYNRRAEFKVIKHGKKTLLIRPARKIPAKYQNPNYKKDYIKIKNKFQETKI